MVIGQEQMLSMRRILQVLLLLCSLDGGHSLPGCRLQGRVEESFFQPGDILIGAVFVIHSSFENQRITFREPPRPPLCKGFQERYYRDALGLIYAVDEINRSPDLLPNISLGFSLFDSCMSELRAVWGALSMVSGGESPIPCYDCHATSSMVGIVGELVSALSLPISRILSVLSFPQISHGSTLSALSNKVTFPSFFRTVPSNMVQNVVLTQLIGQFGWTWVGMLVADNDVGEQGGQAIKAGIERNGICVAFLEKIHLSYSMSQIHRVVDVIKHSSAMVIVLHSPEVHVIALLDALYDKGITQKIIISSASFGLTPGVFSKKAWEVLNGIIGLVPKTGTMPGFDKFLRNLHPSRVSMYPFVRVLWEKVFNCQWPEDGMRVETPAPQRLCTGTEEFGEKLYSLFELNDLSYTYHAYLAVYAYAHAVHAASMCQTHLMDGLCARTELIQPWQILHTLRRTPFRTPASDWMSFNGNGDLPASYDIMNVQIQNNRFNLVKVGTYDPETRQGDTISVNISSIVWGKYYDNVPLSICSNSCLPGYRMSARQGQRICCFDCVPCSQGEIANKSGAAECYKCPTDQWPSEDRSRCVLKVIEFLSFQEPLGIVLVIMVFVFSLLTLWTLIIFIKHRETPIIKATNRELSYILLVSLILCFLCCLVFIDCPSTFTCILRQTFFSIVFSISISSILARTLMVILAFKATTLNSTFRKWLGPKISRGIVMFCSTIQTVICSAWLLLEPPSPRLNTQLENHKVIFECHEGQNLFFYGSLGFLGFLAVVSFLVAFLARNLPDSFNEAKHITFSMLVFCSVWISFIPAYLSTRGKYTVAVQIFAILASSAGLLGCIFAPKCYVILLKPEKNSKEQLMSRKIRTFG